VTLGTTRVGCVEGVLLLAVGDAIGYERFELVDGESHTSTDTNRDELVSPDELIDR